LLTWSLPHLLGNREWEVESGKWDSFPFPTPYSLLPAPPLLLIRLLFLLWLFFILFVLGVFFVLLVLVVFLLAFFVTAQPFDVNGVGFAALFFGDQPLAALVPALAALRLLMAEETILRAELLRLTQKRRIGFGRKR